MAAPRSAMREEHGPDAERPRLLMGRPGTPPVQWGAASLAGGGAAAAAAAATMLLCIWFIAVVCLILFIILYLIEYLCY